MRVAKKWTEQEHTFLRACLLAGLTDTESADKMLAGGFFRSRAAIQTYLSKNRERLLRKEAA